MKDGKCLLTSDNYVDYLEEELTFYTSYDFTQLSEFAGTCGIECRGVIQREAGSDLSIAEYIAVNDFVGVKLTLDDIGPYKYLTYYGKKIRDQRQPRVYVYGDDNSVLAELKVGYQDIDNAWHQYLIDVSQLEGRVTIIFSGGYVDNTGSEDSCYIFSDIVFY